MDKIAISAALFVVDLFGPSSLDGVETDFMFMELPRVFFRLNTHLFGFKLS